jgi:two-component system, OmpR family, phosphate regulon response regulator OmpR
MISLEQRIRQSEGRPDLKSRALVVVSDDLISSLLRAILQAEGLRIVACSTLGTALEEIAFAGFRLVVMDLDELGESGLTAIREAHGEVVPVLALSDADPDSPPRRDLPRCRVLPKPFPLQALRVSIHEFLGEAARTEGPLGCVHFGDYTLDLNTCALSRTGRRVSLSQSEMTILIDLVEHAGEPRAARDLFLRLGGVDQGNRNVVPVYVQRLRRKIEMDPSEPTYIQTVHGFGYKFNRLGRSEKESA